MNGTVPLARKPEPARQSVFWSKSFPFYEMGASRVDPGGGSVYRNGVTARRPAKLRSGTLLLVPTLAIPLLVGGCGMPLHNSDEDVVPPDTGVPDKTAPAAAPVRT